MRNMKLIQNENFMLNVERIEFAYDQSDEDQKSCRVLMFSGEIVTLDVSLADLKETLKNL